VNAPLKKSDVATLVVIASMWGSSFIFMKMLVPALGFATTSLVRLTVGGGVMACAALAQKKSLNLHDAWHHYLIIGLLNSAIPFLFFGLAASHIPVAYSAVGNATSPLWSAAFSALLLREAITPRMAVGFVLGLVGVALTANAGGAALTPVVLLSTAACVGAAFLYGLIGVYMKTRAKHLDPIAMGAGSQLAAALCIIPIALLFPPPVALEWKTAGLSIGQGIWSTGLPYLLYFPLMRRIGPTRALTVTFLVPCFAMVLAVVVLGEALRTGSVLGCALVCSGTFLILRQRST
jgi:drug/metabolite transporter (DMT)-like permease